MRANVDTQALLSAASSVKGIAAGFETELAQLESLVNGTASEWEGPAKESFLETYSKYSKNMREFIASLGNYSTAMTAYANDVESTNQAGSSRFSSI